MDLLKLKEKRHKLALEARAVVDAAKKENRSITAEEKTKVNAMMDELDKLDDEIRTIERLGGIEDDLAEVEQRKVDEHIDTAEGYRETRGGKDGRLTRAAIPGKEYRSAFLDYIRRGRNSLNADQIRALQVGEATEGGNIAYEEFERRIVEKLDELNVMRQLATVIATNGDRNIPVEDGEDEAAYLGEEVAYAEDLTTGGDSKKTFSKVILGAYKLSYIIKLSEELLYDSADIDLEAYLANWIARKFAAKEESSFVNGGGTTLPTGVFPSATVGVTAASALAFTTDELIDLYHSVKRAYRARASWLMNDSIIKVIRKFKQSSNDQYLWQPGMQAGEPDRLLGRPVYATTGAPSSIAAATRVVAFGDMSYYWIADRGARVIQRLNELYAGNGQVGFRAYERHDGKLLVSEAVKVLIMHAST